MIELVVPLVVSIILFSAGCLMAFKIVKDRENWDRFWEIENRNKPLIPKNWAESDTLKLLTYLFAFLFFFGGLIIMLSSFSDLLKYLRY